MSTHFNIENKETRLDNLRYKRDTIIIIVGEVYIYGEVLNIIGYIWKVWIQYSSRVCLFIGVWRCF